MFLWQALSLIESTGSPKALSFQAFQRCLGTVSQHESIRHEFADTVLEE